MTDKIAEQDLAAEAAHERAIEEENDAAKIEEYKRELKETEFNFDGEDEARASKGDYGNAMKNAQFNLSRKINENAMSIIDGDYVIMVKDVKEFIKRIKIIIRDDIDITSGMKTIFYSQLDLLAGEKLT